MGRLLRYPELQTAKGIPFSRMHVDRLEKAGDFPRRVRLAPGTVGWLEEEIDGYVAAKAAERPEA